MKNSTFISNSIPLLTPLRYPGGKQWFFNRAKEFFERRRPSVLLGPFAGGATVELSLLAANLCNRLILVEKDPRVAAFWRAALGDDRLSRRVAKFEPTPENVGAVLAQTPKNDLDWAFWVYVKNRTAFNGNLNGGMAKNQRDWRWKDIPIDLYQIRALASRITFFEGCALDALQVHNSPDYGAFVDPPYVKKGRLQYREHELDHNRLFDILAAWRGRWLLTYDDCQQVRELSGAHGMVCEQVSMRDARHRNRRELVITKPEVVSIHRVPEPRFTVMAPATSIMSRWSRPLRTPDFDGC